VCPSDLERSVVSIIGRKTTEEDELRQYDKK